MAFLLLLAKTAMRGLGKNAEEIGGRANISGKTIGFGGTRGEIQK